MYIKVSNRNLHHQNIPKKMLFKNMLYLNDEDKSSRRNNRGCL